MIASSVAAMRSVHRRFVRRSPARPHHDPPLWHPGDATVAEIAEAVSCVTQSLVTNSKARFARRARQEPSIQFLPGRGRRGLNGVVGHYGRDETPACDRGRHASPVAPRKSLSHSILAATSALRRPPRDGGMAADLWNRTGRPRSVPNLFVGVIRLVIESVGESPGLSVDSVRTRS
jgi:hypothetical protein